MNMTMSKSGIEAMIQTDEPDDESEQNWGYDESRVPYVIQSD